MLRSQPHWQHISATRFVYTLQREWGGGVHRLDLIELRKKMDGRIRRLHYVRRAESSQWGGHSFVLLIHSRANKKWFAFLKRAHPPTHNQLAHHALSATNSASFIAKRLGAAVRHTIHHLRWMEWNRKGRGRTGVKIRRRADKRADYLSYVFVEDRLI
uniref:Uncharacterized protein n=1 Tax=Anopheles minimus TaxID=112268 RepID=A0A182WPV8_9DIPT